MTCALCGSKQTHHFLTVHDRLSIAEDGYLVKCNVCGLICTKDNGYHLKELYINEYYWHLDERPSRISKRLKDMEEWFIKLFLYPEIRAFRLRVNKRDARILEIGCGNGLFLKMLRDCGFFNVTGIEMDKRSAGYGRRRYGLNIINSEFRQTIFEEDSFDVVILNHVLEHIEDPIQFLSHVRNITKNNGLVVVSVPNIESFQARIFRESWFGIEYPRHRYHFSIKTLKGVLETAGFSLAGIPFISMRTNAVCLILSLFPLFDLSKIEQRFKTVRITVLLKGIYLMLLLLTVPLGLIENMLRRGTTITVFAKPSK